MSKVAEADVKSAETAKALSAVWGSRPVRLPFAGELCTCGQPAEIVFLTRFGPVPWCGVEDPA